MHTIHECRKAIRHFKKYSLIFQNTSITNSVTGTWSTVKIYRFKGELSLELETMSLSKKTLLEITYPAGHSLSCCYNFVEQ